MHNKLCGLPLSAWIKWQFMIYHRAGRAATFRNPGFKRWWKDSNPMMQPVAGLMRRIGRTREFVQFYSCMHVEHTLDGPRICIREHGRGLYSIMELPQWLLNHGAPKWFYCLATTYHCCADRKRSVLAPRRLVRAALAFVWSADGSLSSLLAQIVLRMRCKGAPSQNSEIKSMTCSIRLYIVSLTRVTGKRCIVMYFFCCFDGMIEGKYLCHYICKQ